MYILNERDFIREVLVSKEKPKDISLMYLATLIAKYYYHNCNNADELTNLVQNKISEFGIASYQEYIYNAKISAVCNSLFETKNIALKEIEFIPIYEHEMEIVQGQDSERKKKLMFTFFAVARYMDSDGWINKKTASGIAEIFKLANVNASPDMRDKILHELYCDKYITFAKRIDNLNIKVRLDGTGEIAYKVRNFDNLGFQYIGNFKPGWKQCERCGRPIRITGNKKKYCMLCARDVQAIQKEEWRRRNLESAKNRDSEKDLIFNTESGDFLKKVDFV